MDSARPMIRHNQPQVAEADIAAVEAVLRSGWLAHGPRVAALEAAFAALNGGGASCACSSGTAALFLAFRALGLGAGARVALPTYACTALLNAVHMAGAEPVLCDVRADDFTLDPASVPAGLDAAVPVHMFGAPADARGLRGKVRLVVEDCCQSVGGQFHGRALGVNGHAAVYSFYATKVITCGHGGLVWFPDAAAAERALDYRNFDCRREYAPRFNLHLSDINAALALAQFARLAAIRERRLAIARSYAAALPRGLAVQGGGPAAKGGEFDAGRMAYRFVLLFAGHEARDAARERLAAEGVQAAVPVEDWELLHRYLGLDPERFPNAERIAATSLSLPLYPALTDAQVDRICAALNRLEAA